DRPRRQMRKLLVVTVAAFMGVSWGGIAVAQDYPARPITMIVPFPAGGATDTLARFLGERIRAILGQPVIIENVGGAAGSTGVGATGHLTGISFQKATGTKFEFVPYRGNGPAMQDLLAEQIDFMIEPSSNFKALLGAGSVKPLAVTGRARLSSSPNIPTADE